MIYEYYCSDCNITCEITKTIKEIDRREDCTDCGNTMVRHLTGKVGFSGEKTTTEVSYFHHGLGRVVSSDKQAKDIARERGLIEVGNDKQTHLRPKEQSYELSDSDYHDVMGAGVIRGT